MATRTQADHAAMARRFRALADEKRLQIVELLLEGERCVCELVAALQVAQPLLSFHLKTLKQAGLVLDRRAGRWVHYRLNPRVFGEMGALLGRAEECPVCGEVKSSSACCC
jgi:ArsR family transcriptional regulator